MTEERLKALLEEQAALTDRQIEVEVEIAAIMHQAEQDNMAHLEAAVRQRWRPE